MKITPRQRQILHLVAQGYTHYQIAKALCISRRTVGTHLRRLYEDWRVGKATQAVEKARRLGVIG